MEQDVSTGSYPKWWRFLWACALALCTPACLTSPVTGRTSFNPFPKSEDVKLGTEAYDQVLAEAKVVPSGPGHDMVARAMKRLVAVCDDKSYPWEVNLLQDDQTVNAFALPGGKMAVYTGILPVCKNETGLAVVMGHEIGHVVARHGTQRMTTTLGMNVVMQLLNLGDYTQLATTLVDLTFNLPFGRTQESDA